MIDSSICRVLATPKRIFIAITRVAISTIMLSSAASASEASSQLSAKIVNDSSQPVWTDGTWKVFAYPSEGMCDLGQRLATGAYITIGYAPGQSRISLFVFNKNSNNLQVGSRMSLEVSFYKAIDAPAVHRGTLDFKAIATEWGTGLLTVDTDTEFLDNFSRSSAMRIADGTSEALKLYLQGSSQAIQVLRKCADLATNKAEPVRSVSPQANQESKIESNRLNGSVEIYGIRIGEKIKYSECPATEMLSKWMKKKSRHNYEFPYSYSISAPCYQRYSNPMSSDQIINEEITMIYPNSISVGKNGFKVYIRQGVVDLIEIETKGMETQAADYDNLIKKFGRPSKENIIDLQNGFGAKFQSVNALWTLSNNGIIYFSSRFAGDNWGKLVLGTDDGVSQFINKYYGNNSNTRL